MRQIRGLIAIFLTVLVMAGCGRKSRGSAANDNPVPETPAEKTVTKDISDLNIDKSKTFLVISKLDLTLSVYAGMENDTLLVARYPVCVGKNLGQKEGRGDMRTPESSMENPFTITQIQDASEWHHDFGDGRGSIKAYGHWFLRLNTPPFSGIGIHGSTNNESSVPGRGSEGCIRLKDEDIIQLKEKWAWIGMPVIIKHEQQGNLPFEK